MMCEYVGDLLLGGVTMRKFVGLAVMALAIVGLSFVAGCSEPQRPVYLMQRSACACCNCGENCDCAQKRLKTVEVKPKCTACESK